MEVCRRSSWLLPLIGVILLAEALQGVQGEIEIDGPSETECRPYIEKALRELENVGAGDADVGQSNEAASSIDNISVDEKRSDEQRSSENSENETETQESQEKEALTSSGVEQPEELQSKTDASTESDDKDNSKQMSAEQQDSSEQKSDELQAARSTEAELQDIVVDQIQDAQSEEGINEERASTELVPESASVETAEDVADVLEQPSERSLEESSTETRDDTQEEASTETAELKQEPSAESLETTQASVEENKNQSVEQAPTTDDDVSKHEGSDERANSQSAEDSTNKGEELDLVATEGNEIDETPDASIDDSKKEASDEDLKIVSGERDHESNASIETDASKNTSDEDNLNTDESDKKQQEDQSQDTEEVSRDKRSVKESTENEASKESDNTQEVLEDSIERSDVNTKSTEESQEAGNIEAPEAKASAESSETNEVQEQSVEVSKVTDQQGLPDSKEKESQEGSSKEKESKEDDKSDELSKGDEKEASKEDAQSTDSSKSESTEDAPEEELISEIDIPKDLRSRDHVEQLLKLDREATKTEEVMDRISEITLRELKRLYENAIKPLETLYKYRDLSNRHYGDAEIFSKPLILFMGPWSGGKSSIINYLLNVEYNDTALRTGAEPSPAYFNLLVYGEEEEVLDGTQLAADYTFSGLQKFGQGLEERLRGVKLRSKLLEKVNIVEIPGILEVRKQVSRVFPFNDACQWFIDRADIIFLVYDPSKLDVGPETEAILDQLKGREYQTRIVLNKADQVKPEELMRVQGALIWNISPLMSSPQPPVMYTTSLWSRPYEQWAPVRLLQAQERAFLRDLRSAIDRRIENKIASARRFAVRVRNHAKMVDCYLTTYYNHKSIFGNRKQVSDAIIDHPQDYHIYEGLSTLTNISRYDLPDPDVYKDFFRLNPLYEFQQLSATCTYFRGCPINKLDVAIAYDLPELVGKHKRLVESALAESNQEKTPGS